MSIHILLTDKALCFLLLEVMVGLMPQGLWDTSTSMVLFMARFVRYFIRSLFERFFSVWAFLFLRGERKMRERSDCNLFINLLDWSLLRRCRLTPNDVKLCLLFGLFGFSFCAFVCRLQAFVLPLLRAQHMDPSFEDTNYYAHYFSYGG